MSPRSFVRPSVEARRALTAAVGFMASACSQPGSTVMLPTTQDGEGCSDELATASNESTSTAPLERGCMGRGGPGGPGGPGMPMDGSHCALGSGPLSDAVRAAVERALEDERRSEATYAEVQARLGPMMPFRMIERSEQRHSATLERLLTAHGLPVPAPSSFPPIAPVADRPAACRLGVESERANIALYDELLAAGPPDDVRCVFESLREASRSHHLPAFERCSAAR